MTADDRALKIALNVRSGSAVAGAKPDGPPHGPRVGRLPQNGKPREILYVGEQDEPLDVILLFDTSLSMRPVVERVARTSRAALAELRAGDRAAVMAFSTRSVSTLMVASQRSSVDSA